jgi:hypothetical protein
MPIDGWGYCRYVDNNSSGATSISIFVPFRSAPEWGTPTSSFGFIGVEMNGKLAESINLVKCARPSPVGVQVPDNFPTPGYPANLPACNSGTVRTVIVPQYGRVGPIPKTYQAQPITFKCADGWFLTANPTFTASADNDPPLSPLSTGGWTLTSVIYSGDGLPIDGVCGLGTNTCSAGTPSGYNASEGTWTCSGSDGGTNASCPGAKLCVCGSALNTCVTGYPVPYNQQAVSGTYGGVYQVNSRCLPEASLRRSVSE